MLQLFTYNPEDISRERGYFYTMKQQLAVIALNIPFAATEEMKIVSQSARKVVQSSSDISIFVVAMCFVVATLIMIIGSNVPMRLEKSKIIKDRKAKIKVQYNATVQEVVAINICSSTFYLKLAYPCNGSVNKTQNCS
ncbi:MAG: hypothetical protein EZS28_036407 [Streblomastix strix]|uniref:Uncharacterized protein n=1 Tax=Streblomastix strix TaxID=222440 RepID=A0A5J4UC24_9EUKA|nr:MAG: hypothetical protein EZS28_036407 [Streblomastix strix]